ncbi:MAG: MBOAT family protein, partial [Planctomycetales bacterium]|nr:MBOAT family protein [Planctomycetales bacterium]
VFYGFVHPWFCILIAASTVVDFACGWLMEAAEGRPLRRKLLLFVSIAANLGMLGVFKYYNFFVGNVEQLLGTLGLHVEPLLLQVVLPAGISFYTFQTLSYTIDVYRGQLRACRNPIDFAVFVSCFPQLVAGPIERASRLLPQIETPRVWNWDRFLSAIPLLVLGFFKKMVVADNLAGWVQQVYMLQSPSLYVLLAGTVAFAMQILADFSAYTDIARGCSRILGIELQENFNSPYLSVSPSDFWRRWHISLSSWIRDYLYVPLGGSQVESRWRHAWILILTFSLSGLWHGAQWHFVMWGLYNGLLLVAYHVLGMGGRWRPARWWQLVPAWGVMMMFTLVGWSLFRASSMTWLASAVGRGDWGLAGDDLYAGTLILGYCVAYGVGWVLFRATTELRERWYWSNVLCHWGLFACLLLLANRDPEAFIYFQF